MRSFSIGLHPHQLSFYNSGLGEGKEGSATKSQWRWYFATRSWENSLRQQFFVMQWRAETNGSPGPTPTKLLHWCPLPPIVVFTTLYSYLGITPVNDRDLLPHSYPGASPILHLAYTAPIKYNECSNWVPGLARPDLSADKHKLQSWDSYGQAGCWAGAICRQKRYFMKLTSLKRDWAEASK